MAAKTDCNVSFLLEFLPAHLDVALRHDEVTRSCSSSMGPLPPPALARADPDYSAQRGSHGPFKQLREGCVTGSLEERTFDVQVDEVSIEIAALR